MRKSKLFVSSLVYFITMCVLIAFYILMSSIDLSFLSDMAFDVLTTIIIQIVIILLILMVSISLIGTLLFNSV